MLYLVATPIGNLGDMTFRAVSTLMESDYVLCEDTRQSRILLAHYQISTPLISFHKFNESMRIQQILSDLEKGKKVSLISDAGMPVICDPGARLIQACRAKGLAITVIPGPTAFASAFALAGWSGTHFQFIGFFPRNRAEICDLLTYPGTTLGYESPKRLCRTLLALPKSTHVAVARELTKIHEEFRAGTAESLYLYYHDLPPKGEIVLLIQRRSAPNVSDEELRALVKERMEAGESFSEAVRYVANIHGRSRRDLYNANVKS
jgi:16S rRNA (cytidine1402-2'-O)-methyltransferase